MIKKPRKKTRARLLQFPAAKMPIVPEPLIIFGLGDRRFALVTRVEELPPKPEVVPIKPA